MTSDKTEGKMLSIWTWSALILAAYGLILLALGIYRVATGDLPETRMAESRPDIWWPIVMLVLAAGLALAGRAESRSEK